MKIELYLVKSSSGSYDDYREYNEKIIYATLEAAEKRRDEIIMSHKKPPFPFDWCTKEEFDNIMDNDEVTDDVRDRYYEWQSNCYEADEFGGSWIQTVELDQQSWREKKLAGILGSSTIEE
jgi:hypothetical protein